VAHKPVELILLRQLASRLPFPVALVDDDATLVYFNAATERMLGYKLDDLGDTRYRALNELLDYRHADGSPMKDTDMPMAVVLHERRPNQMTIIIHGADGAPHLIENNSIPLHGQGGVLLGAMSIFWEADTAG
jgi:PAS domain S-box-containing protein